MYFLFFCGGAQIFFNWPLNFITVVAIARLLCSRFVRDIILCDVICALAKYRYSSNMRESSSESDDVEENDGDIKGCYMNEPEYLEKEINAMNILENQVGSKIFTGVPVLNMGLLWLWGYKNVNAAVNVKVC